MKQRLNGLCSKTKVDQRLSQKSCPAQKYFWPPCGYYSFDSFFYHFDAHSCPQALFSHKQPKGKPFIRMYEVCVFVQKQLAFDQIPF